MDIYPNPATHFVAIDSILNIEKVEVFNFSGKLLIAEKHPEIIDVRNLSEGLYVIKIYRSMGVCVEQIIKKQLIENTFLKPLNRKISQFFLEIGIRWK